MSDTQLLAASASVWALLVGIDQYRSPRINTLRGCVNDVEAMRLFLTRQLRVPEQQVKLLANADATRANILDAFQQFLIDNPAIPHGSQILFHYSGHGSQMPSQSATEPDALDETIVPHDSRTGDVYDIPDKTLAALLDRLAARKGDNITLILDSCHSGSATRALGDWASAPVRRIPADDRLPPAELDRDLRASARARRALAAGWAAPEASYVLLAGCRDHEQSNEYQAAEGVWHGALSFFTLEYLRQLPPNAAYADLHERVAAQVNAVYKDQMPQCEGQSRRSVFGGAQVERDPFITVQSVQDHTLTLAAGLVHGLRVGAELAIYPVEVKTRAELPARALATVTVSAVSATTAQAAPLDTPRAALTPLMRALVTRQVYGGLRVTVALEAGDGGEDADSLARLRAAIDHAAPDGGPSPYLEVPDDPRALAQLRVRAQAGRLSIFGPDDALLVTPVEISANAGGRDAIGATVRALESIARFRALQMLTNREAGSRVAGHVHLRLRHSVDGAPPGEMPLVEKGAGGELVLEYDAGSEERNRYVVEIANESALDVYPHLFYLNPDFAIYRLYPAQGQQEQLKAGGTLYSGAPNSGGKPVDIFLPEDPYWASSRDSLKLIVTTAPSDLGLLEQPALDVPPPASGARALPSPFEQLLDAVAFGAGTRFLRPSQSAAGEDWATAELSCSIVRRTATTALAAGREQVTLSDGFSLQKPKSFVGQVSISTLQQATRGDAVPKPPPALEREPEAFQPLQRASTRGVGSAALVITFETDDASLQSISERNPLRLQLPERAEAADLLPVAFDGEDYLLVGYGADRLGAVNIVNLPRAAAPRPTRDLKHAITLFIYKKMGRYAPELGLRCAQLQNGRAVYSAVTREQFKPGDTVALFVHGFTSDTRWMVEGVAPFLRERALNYTHLLTFDYESFGTGVAENGEALALALRQQCGFAAGDQVTLHVYAHSMGCLVARCMVELSRGSEFVDRVVLAGPPNHGTTLASGSRGLAYVVSGLLNRVSLVPPLGALNWLSAEVYEQGKGWSDIAVDSAVTRQLNALAQPSNVPYLALVGENALDANLQSRLNRLARKLLDSTLDNLFGERNDSVIGVSSMQAVRNGAYPLLTTSLLPCDHFGYYADAQAQAAIRQWVNG